MFLIRPSSVIFADSNWQASQGAFPDAWQLIDETPANDADFISVVIAGQVNFGLEDFPPGVVTALQVEWRYSTGPEGVQGALQVALIEGEDPLNGTLIASDTVTHPTVTFADWTSRTLTVPDPTVIGNFNDLALVFSYSGGQFNANRWRVTRGVIQADIANLIQPTATTVDVQSLAPALAFNQFVDPPSTNVSILGPSPQVIQGILVAPTIVDVISEPATLRDSVLQATTTALTLVVEVGFVDSEGLNPRTLRFSDQPHFYMRDGQAIDHYPLIEDLVPASISRVQGDKLRGSSLAEGGVVKILPDAELLEEIEGLHCERQAVIIKKGRPYTDDADFAVTWRGIAEGHESSGGRLTIQLFPFSKFLETDFQNQTWEGRGRHIQVDDTRPEGGFVRIDPPADPTAWDIAGAVTIEIGFTAAAAAAAGEELARRADTFRARRTAAGEVEVDWTLEAGGTLTFTGTSTMLSTGFHHVAVRWDGIRLSIFVDGVLDLEADAGAPNSASTDPWILGGGEVGSTQWIGALDFLRYWRVARTDQEIADNTSSALEPLDDLGLELNLPMSEGLGAKTFDPDRAHHGALQGNARWTSSGTGDAQLQGQKKPSAFGHQTNVDPVLLDPIEQIYAVHFRSVRRIVPRVGGRELAEAWWLTGAVHFVETDNILRGTPGGVDFSKMVPYQSIEVSGSSHNDRVFEIAEEPRRIDATWEVKLRQTPVEEVATAVTVESITSFTQRVEETATGDFDAEDRVFRAETPGDLSGFTVFRTVQVLGAGSANDGRSFKITQDPWQDDQGRWKLKLDTSPIAEPGVVVTLLQVHNLGEYSVDLERGQFTLHFEPTKKVTAEVFGDDEGGYVDTSPEIILRMLAVMGSNDSRALPVAEEHIGQLLPAYSWEAGFYDAGGTSKTTLNGVLDTMAHGSGLHWIVSPRSGLFDLVDLPPTTSFRIDRDFAAQASAFSIKKVRARKARRHVEVRFARNHVTMATDELDFFLATDLGRAGQEAIQALRNKWQSAVYPEAGDQCLEPDVVDSPLVRRSDAAALARRLFAVMGTSNSFYDLTTTLAPQGDEPWYVAYRLSDPEDPHLVEPRAAYPVTLKDKPFESRLVLMVVEDA